MQVQWYPGHMTKAKRAMKEDIKLVDLIIELTDARLPLSGRNPDIDELGAGKARMILLNKADLADERRTKEWMTYFNEKEIQAVRIDARSRGTVKAIQEAVLIACKEKIERDKRRGIQNRPIRAMVVGIPNVGKSTFINTFAGKSCAKTGNKPGVTKGNQWIRLNKQVELLDTPGILWPKFDDQQVGLRLAFVGSVNDEILNKQELAVELIHFLRREYPNAISERYQITDEAEKDFEVLEKIADVRGCIQKGGIPDPEKAAKLFVDDFRSGRLGKITLERVPEKAAPETENAE